MYSVYYKFKSAKDFDTISIDTPEVPLGKLKQLIVQQKKLGKLTDFDLVITNSQTKEGTSFYFLEQIKYGFKFFLKSTEMMIQKFNEMQHFLYKEYL